MRLDASQLETFVLAGSAVTLLAIMAARWSSRAGLPTLLIYLLIGVLLGESVLGIPFEDADLTPSARVLVLSLLSLKSERRS